ncbi:MAG: HNH endonuclease signature motif containing protein [Aliarcobacter sp.]|nr:HNH endonuclease signature motif containing protein [Aliarcobacter sp.]
MRLNLDFIIYSSLLVSSLIPLYIYRKKIFKTKYKKDDGFSIFIKDLKLHMAKHHPKIKLDYSIIEKTQNEQDFKIREILIIENIIEQFYNYNYQKKTQETVPSDKLWVNYIEKSKSNTKYPNDWLQRREIAWRRDNKSCNRCGNIISLDNACTSFVKEIKDGGGYNFENIIILCSDCNKIINSNNPKNTIISLSLNDGLMIYVKK